VGPVWTTLRRTTDGVAAGDSDTAVPLHLLLLLVAFAVGVIAQGGYYLSGRILVVVLLGVGALVAVASRPRSGTEAKIVLLACAVLAAWALIRAAMAGGYLSALPTVATLAGIAGAVVILARTDSAARQQCGRVLIGLGGLIALIGWVGVAWRQPPWGTVVQGLWRGSATLTYANATAALLAALAVLAVGYRLQRPDSALAAAPLSVLLVGLWATVSRAGVFAFLVGLVVLMLLRGVRPVVRQAVPPVAGALIAFAALLPALPTGTPARPGLATAGLVVGVLVAVYLARLARDRPVAAFLTVGLLAAAISWITIQLAGSAVATVAATRLNLASFGRTGATRAAIQMVTAQPVMGVGPGRARFFWVDSGGRGFVARYAHNEYLQLVVELGFIGLAILLILLAALIATVVKGRPAAQPAPGLWAGAAAAFAVLIVHSAFDFLWQLPVIPLTGALLVGLAGPGTSAPVVNRPQFKEEPCGKSP
jgi:hypothetical protein